MSRPVGMTLDSKREVSGGLYVRFLQVAERILEQSTSLFINLVIEANTII